jgi:MYND finger
MCHSTGVGQPPHFVYSSDLARTRYRVSPLARCPCGVTAKTYYRCCWTDNGAPKYLDDTTGYTCNPTSDWTDPVHECLRRSHIDDKVHAAFMANQRQLDDAATEFTRRFHESPSLFERVCFEAGPKTRMTTWDWRVYAGCLERLGRPLYVWMDVHWNRDRTTLLRQVREWNAALEKYCDDVGLQGEERELVVHRHTANPCGPCGFIGCDAFETKVREFEWCAQCKAIAYCSRRCQRKDWAEHSKICKSGLSIGDAVLVRTGGLNSAEERRGLQESESSDGASGGSGRTTNSTGPLQGLAAS